ncbi:hypothetical protein SAMN05216553_102590 [Lentzea fradiae]|uniref:Uncharacterized protein n=2 Tax=Lentzea fradiae TaxID=200378 RepID=A0A1G7MZ86_9PSEU|nr:hypothetical protein SAMN05216553_102590 [Lentzea fradiae]
MPGSQNQGWHQNQPPQQQWGPPPPRGRGILGLAIAVAAGAAGLAVFWGILGIKGVIGKHWVDIDPEGTARRLAMTGGSGALLTPLSIGGIVFDLLTMVVLIAGALLIVLRKLPGAFLVAGSAVLGVLAAACRFVYYVQLDWSAPSEPYVAATLTLILGVLAILPPVTDALRPTAAPHPGGQPQFPQQPPPPGYGPPQGPPPGYGPPQGPPPPGYGPPR